ncbi:unnamed protein product [Musa hybrid cultivar]
MSQEADLTLRSRARATCTQLLSTQTDYGGDNSREKSEPRKRVSGAPRMETTGERTADLPLRGQRSERRIAATRRRRRKSRKSALARKDRWREGPQRKLPCTGGGAEWFDWLSWAELSRIEL